MAALALTALALAAQADAPLSYQEAEARARELSGSTVLLRVRLKVDASATGDLAPEGTAMAAVVLDPTGRPRVVTSGPLVAGSATLQAQNTALLTAPESWRPLGDGALVVLERPTPALVGRPLRAPPLPRNVPSVTTSVGAEGADGGAATSLEGEAMPAAEVRPAQVEYGAVAPDAPQRVFVALPSEPGAGFQAMGPVLAEAILTPALDLPVSGLAVVTPRLPLGCPLYDADGAVAGVVFRWHDEPDRVWAVTGAWLRDALRPEGPPWDPPPPPAPPAPGLRGARGRR